MRALQPLGAALRLLPTSLSRIGTRSAAAAAAAAAAEPAPAPAPSDVRPAAAAGGGPRPALNKTVLVYRWSPEGEEKPRYQAYTVDLSK